MDCPRCGEHLRGGTRFCTACGLSTAEIAAETVKLMPGDSGPGVASGSFDPLLGSVLDSKYELVARLGEGGMGTVYRARRLHIGDEVAVKVLHPRALLDEGAVERFGREARSAAAVSHPNVVTIHDFSAGPTGGAPAYLVMELVRGTSLRALLEREKRLGERQALALMGDICAGLAAAHRKGVVHRDLKPDNIIVVQPGLAGEREFAKVVDFGIAKRNDLESQMTLTHAGALVGSPYYMSPEQCTGERVDARADVYSLGAMLYEMLTGAPPFRAENIGALIAKHLSATPPPFPPALGLSPPLEAACLRALSKRPAERQADAADFYREVSAAADSLAVSQAPYQLSHLSTARADNFGVPAAPPPAAIRSRLRLPILAAAALMLLVCFAAAVAFAWYRWGSSGVRATRADVASQTGAGSQAVQAPAPEAENRPGEGVEADGIAAEKGVSNLGGKWEGVYGPMKTSATLSVKDEGGGRFSGVLEQGAVRVAFSGTFDTATRRVKFKESRVLSGDNWSLGENTGELSTDGQTISGTGSDSLGAQLGMTYSWSFSRH